MQQHGGRPQGECPSHWLGERAIHQLPATTLVTSSARTGKAASADIWNRLVFAKSLSLWFYSIVIHI